MITIIVKEMDSSDEEKGFCLNSKYQAKDLHNGFFKVYAPNGEIAAFSQKKVRLVKR